MSEERERSQPVAAAMAIETPGPAAPDLEQVFRDHYGQVYRAAYRITGNPADAEDVLQTVFLRLTRRGAETRVDTMGSYLHRAAVNAALDLMRSRHHARGLPLEDAEPEALESPGASPEREQSSAELREWLRRTVARFGPQAAEIFALRFFEEIENIEIARMLGTSQSAVAVTVHRIRERIQREYRAQFGS